ncbi:VapC toxin family PIN domain ribonuclease [Kineococcus glutinatus]|uniref:PIN domain-containing protein n=1 Tax=Kineococcus glutinatus TaxID=1070872 RepID=A0ABP9H718_9ACTN
MAVLIDTDALIDGLVVDGASISILTMFELAGGIDSVTDPVERAARQRRYDDAAAVVAIGRRSRPRHLDLMIAATARAHDLTPITSDLDDYRGLETLLEVTRP